MAQMSNNEVYARENKESIALAMKLQKSNNAAYALENNKSFAMEVQNSNNAEYARELHKKIKNEGNNAAYARELHKKIKNEESAGKLLNNGMSINQLKKLQKKWDKEDWTKKLQKEETINEQFAKKLQKQIDNELKNNDELSAEDKKKHLEDLEKFRLSIMKKNKKKKNKKKKNKKKAGSYIRGKKVRKHQGIIQTGGNAGRLRKGYRYSSKKLKSGLPQIIKCKSKKC
jgi:hypothetical protein